VRAPLVLGAVLAIGLAGCNTPFGQMTPQQAAAYSQAFCVLSADGAVLAVASTKGGAQATAQKIAAAQPVACDVATQVGTVLAK